MITVGFYLGVLAVQQCADVRFVPDEREALQYLRSAVAAEIDVITPVSCTVLNNLIRGASCLFVPDAARRVETAPRPILKVPLHIRSSQGL